MKFVAGQFFHGKSKLSKTRRGQLRLRFVISFIFFAVVPVLFLGGVGMYLIDLSHQRDISNLELQLLEQKNEEIGKFFADITGSVRLNIGSADEQQEIVSETERTDKEIQLLLENMMNSNKAFQEISLISRDGVEVAKITRSSAGVELVSIDEKIPKYSSIIIG